MPAQPKYGGNNQGGQFWFDRSLSKTLMNDAMIRSSINRLIKEGGKSNHSAMGMTLGLTIRELERVQVPYTLVAWPGAGYYLTVPPPGERDPTVPPREVPPPFTEPQGDRD